jgi:hypothetical protein
MGVLDAFDTEQNIRGGARYLSLLLQTSMATSAWLRLRTTQDRRRAALQRRAAVCGNAGLRERVGDSAQRYGAKRCIRRWRRAVGRSVAVLLFQRVCAARCRCWTVGALRRTLRQTISIRWNGRRCAGRKLHLAAGFERGFVPAQVGRIADVVVADAQQDVARLDAGRAAGPPGITSVTCTPRAAAGRPLSAATGTNRNRHRASRAPRDRY